MHSIFALLKGEWNMKRRLEIAIILLCCIWIVGCNASSSNEYKLKVEGITENLIEPLKEKYQAGTKIEIKLAPVTDIGFYVYANNKEVKMTHFDSDYWGYEFTMPSEDVCIYITSDEFYGKDEYNFEEVFWWAKVLKQENVAKVQVEKGAIAVAPGSLIDKAYSEDERDIANLFTVLNQKLVKVSNPQIDGGSYINYTFYQDDNAYTLEICNRYVVYSTFSSRRYFAFVDEDYQLPQLNFANQNVYAFIGYDLKTKIYDATHQFVCDYAYLSFLEFVEEESSMVDINTLFYVKSDFGNIYIKTPKTFIYKDVHYRITNQYQFDFTNESIRIDHPQKSNRNVQKITQLMGENKKEFVNLAPTWMIDEYQMDVFETMDKRNAFLMYDNEVISLYPFGLEGTDGIKQFCVADINEDGYVELYMSINYGTNCILNKIYCFDTFTKKMIESYTDYKKINYFQIEKNTLWAGDYLQVQKRDVRVTFDKLVYATCCDVFKADIQIDQSEANFPIAFEYLGENSKYQQEYSILFEVTSQYIGPTFTYMGSSSVYGPIVSLKHNDTIYHPDLMYACDVVEITILEGRTFRDTYSIALPNSIEKGAYDIVISYNGVVLTIEHALIIS